MSSGPNIDIVRGIPGSQIDIDQVVSEITARENEIRIAIELRPIEPDYFVGPNGKALPKALKGWIGKSRRDSLLKKAKDPLVHNVIHQLYRPGSFIGDGGTASIIKLEKATGLGLGRNGNTHMQKGKEITRYIDNKILSRNNLRPSDRKLAQKLKKALQKAIWR